MKIITTDTQTIPKRCELEQVALSRFSFFKNMIFCLTIKFFVRFSWWLSFLNTESVLKSKICWSKYSTLFLISCQFGFELNWFNLFVVIAVFFFLSRSWILNCEFLCVYIYLYFFLFSLECSKNSRNFDLIRFNVIKSVFFYLI